PAFQRLRDELAELRDLRMVRVTTLESPIPPYVHQYPLHRATDLPQPLLEELRREDEARVTAAVGPTDDLGRWAYRWVLLDTLVHEFNTVRGVLGEPDRLESVDVRKNSLTTLLDFGGVPCIIAWVDLPGIARYSMEFAF